MLSDNVKSVAEKQQTLRSWGECCSHRRYEQFTCHQQQVEDICSCPAVQPAVGGDCKHAYLLHLLLLDLGKQLLEHTRDQATILYQTDGLGRPCHVDTAQAPSAYGQQLQQGWMAWHSDSYVSVEQIHKRPKVLVPLSITTDPSPAALTVNGMSCTALSAYVNRYPNYLL